MSETPQPLPARRSETFLNEVIRVRHPNWNGFSWDDWSPKETATFVRHIAHDYLDDHGFGHDWQEAGRKAEFILAGVYNDVLHVRFPGVAHGHDHDVRLRMEAPGFSEAFEVLLQRPTEHLLPPLTLSGLGLARLPQGSVVGQATARAPARSDALTVPDESVLRVLDQLVAFFGQKDRFMLMMAAALWVRWKGLQVGQVIQGGAVYRDIKNESFPHHPASGVRVVYARIGPDVSPAVVGQGAYANVVLLV